MGTKKQEPSTGVVGIRKNVPIEDMKLDPKNPRAWDAGNLSVTRASIRSFGFVEPLVLNIRTGFLVAGHQRLAALRKEGAKSVPFVTEGDWTAGDARALSFVLNSKATRGRFVSKKAKPLLDDLEATHAQLYAQLGLGTILEQAEAEEAGNGTGKKRVEFNADAKGWETYKCKVPPGVRAIIEQKVALVQEIHEFKTPGQALEVVFSDYEPHRVAGVGA
jgi:hypothetical protein